ncbi:collagen triple helix repeat-containing protein 1-like [Oscarella lobularis]|uniref:collagen triple helix repeat-containing protein 1-like n=1 Tax=Oscarella lobularis TaxID=121494 RepID=UPI003313B3BB
MNIRSTLQYFYAALTLFHINVEGNSLKSDQGYASVCSGLPGIPGTPGHNGLPGRDGLQGHKGSEGTKGAKGSKGATGKTGPKGSSSEKGPIGIGQMGLRGEKGAKGNLGDPGPRGENGTVNSINWKQCVWNKQDPKDTGLIQECVFKKRHSSTALKVTYGATMRVQCSRGGCCGRWYVTFNGAECSGPMAIDGVVYVSIKSNVHRPRQIEGLCENIPSGLIRVAVHVGNCASYGTSDRESGWNSGSRIMIEEYPQSQNELSATFD